MEEASEEEGEEESEEGGREGESEPSLPTHCGQQAEAEDISRADGIPVSLHLSSTDCIMSK